jgi:hypothetical protein
MKRLIIAVLAMTIYLTMSWALNIRRILHGYLNIMLGNLLMSTG